MIKVLLFSFLTLLASCESEMYCKKNGFDSKVLECSTCTLIKEQLKNEKVYNICRKCCSNYKDVCFLKVTYFI